MRVCRWLLIVVSGMILQACGGGSGGGSTTMDPVAMVQDDVGEIVIALTDAEGDFTTYGIDVTSVVLRKANGTVVETLPLRTRVDFAELTEVTEFLTVATVPVGVYESVSLGLDFTDAEVIVQDDFGVEQRTTLVDESGDPLGALTVRLQLTSSDRIRIAVGIPAAFSLDFDLDASNEIDHTTAPPTVTVMPFLLATPELEADRAHRLRGVLDTVDEETSSVTLKVRPFRHRTGDFGRFRFFTDDETLYEIDGAGFEGAAGLMAMAELAENIPVVVGGMVTDGGFVAATVLAGTSVPWTQYDVVSGVVVARTDGALTVRGAVIEYTDGIVARRAEMTVLVGEGTNVTALGLDNDLLTQNSISVGQRIVAFGELTDDLSLNASESHVRMQISGLTAEVVAETPLAVDLIYLNGRRPAVYDFSGTGVSPDDDADPSFYQIDTSTLPLSSIDSGDLVRVRGHVNEFGAAPEDFLALTVIDVARDMRGAGFAAVWETATADPLLSIDPASIELDLEMARAVLKVLGVPLEATNPLESLKLVAPDGGRGVYAVRVRGSDQIHLFLSFADLVEEVIAQLDTGSRLKRVGASGRYNRTTEELISGRAGFEFIAPDS